MNAHKAAAVFPMLSGEELDALADDIAKHGQREPIVLLDGEILDGRNRFAACGQACVDPIFVEADDAARADPIAFVVSKNLHRRHMDSSQRAMAAARLREFACQNSDSPMGLRDAGVLLNVSHQAVAEAARVLDRGAPEVVAAVERGDVAVSAANALVGLPLEEQREAVATPAKAKAKAREIRTGATAPAKVSEPSAAPALEDLKARLRALLKEGLALAAQLEAPEKEKVAKAPKWPPILRKDLPYRAIRIALKNAQKLLTHAGGAQ